MPPVPTVERVQAECDAFDLDYQLTEEALRLLMDSSMGANAEEVRENHELQ
jgi:hypothetical protein